MKCAFRTVFVRPAVTTTTGSFSPLKTKIRSPAFPIWMAFVGTKPRRIPLSADPFWGAISSQATTEGRHYARLPFYLPTARDLDHAFQLASTTIRADPKSVFRPIETTLVDRCSDPCAALPYLPAWRLEARRIRALYRVSRPAPCAVFCCIQRDLPLSVSPAPCQGSRIGRFARTGRGVLVRNTSCLTSPPAVWLMTDQSVR
jgi:hypothetical protein